MSKDDFILKINKAKVDLTHIKSGIKREDIQDEKMQSIFDAIDTDGEKGVLSEDEINQFFGLVKEQAQKHNKKNLGKREYKKLLKDLEAHGIKIENAEELDKKTFLQFLFNLKEAGDKHTEAAEQQQEAVKPLGEVFEEAKDKGLSSEKQTTTVVVQPDETPESLAEKFGCDVEELKELNKDKLINDGKGFQTGTEVVIPKEVATELLEGRKSAAEIEEAGKKAAVKRVPKNKGKQTVVKGDGDKGNAPVTNEVKVTVPVAYHGKRTQQIIKYRDQGEKLTASLKKNDTKGVSVQNLAYAFTSEVKFQDMTEKTIHFVFVNLVQRLRDLGIFEQGKDYGNYDSFKKLSPSSQITILRKYRNRIVAFENQITRSDSARVTKSNAQRAAQQKVFDDANKLLNDAASHIIQPTIESGKTNKAAKIGDNQKIEVYYNKDGSISYILIYNGNKKPAARYSAEGASVNTAYDNDKYERTIKSGYDFEKIKAAAEAIFGKYEAPKAEEKKEEAKAGDPPKEGIKFTTDQIKVEVKLPTYSKTQYQNYVKEGEALVENYSLDKMNTHNVAYFVSNLMPEIQSTEDSGFAHEKEVFGYLVQRMRDLDIFEEGRDYGSYTTFSKLGLKKRNKILSEYAERIRIKDYNRVFPQQEANKQQKVFNGANKFLVDMANDSTHLSATIGWEKVIRHQRS